MKVLIAVDAATHDLTDDDRCLAEELVRSGMDPEPLLWGGPVPRGAVVVVRSTWDYVHRYERFLSWLDLLDASEARVWNTTATCRWGAHKGYLAALAERGVSTVPTEVVARRTRPALGELMATRGWSDAVVKPAVGGTARLAVHVAAAGMASAEAHLATVAAREDVIVQPFVSSVAARGEVSVIVVDGEPVAAVEKRARPGEWRVQSDFGGTVRAVALDDELRSIVGATTDALDDDLLYARVDVVELPDGAPAVLEVEVVEPELFFSIEPTIAPRFVEGLRRRIAEPR